MLADSVLGRLYGYWLHSLIFRFSPGHLPALQKRVSPQRHHSLPRQAVEGRKILRRERRRPFYRLALEVAFAHTRRDRPLLRAARGDERHRAPCQRLVHLPLRLPAAGLHLRHVLRAAQCVVQLLRRARGVRSVRHLSAARGGRETRGSESPDFGAALPAVRDGLLYKPHIHNRHGGQHPHTHVLHRGLHAALHGLGRAFDCRTAALAHALALCRSYGHGGICGRASASWASR